MGELLEILDEGRDATSATASLKWLRTKLSEAVGRYKAALPAGAEALLAEHSGGAQQLGAEQETKGSRKRRTTQGGRRTSRKLSRGGENPPAAASRACASPAAPPLVPIVEVAAGQGGAGEGPCDVPPPSSSAAPTAAPAAAPAAAGDAAPVDSDTLPADSRRKPSKRPRGACSEGSSAPRPPRRSSAAAGAERMSAVAAEESRPLKKGPVRAEPAPPASPQPRVSQAEVEAEVERFHPSVRAPGGGER